MQTGASGIADKPSRPADAPELKEVVMGLHWDPPAEGVATHPDDLDALCALLDGERNVLEVIHPGRPRNAGGSVVHTGDSRTGASEWDDERIFIFLDALPASVASLALVVANASGQPFDEIRGASCHVSDHATEHKWIDMNLASLGKQSAHCIAVLHRGPAGWEISRNGQFLEESQLAALLSIVKSEKSRGS